MSVPRLVLAAGFVLGVAAVGAPPAVPDRSAPAATPYADRLVLAADSTSTRGPIKSPSPLATASWGLGRIDVFHQSARGTLEQTTYATGKGWSRAPSLGGSMTSGPAVASTEPGRLHVFARGGDAAVWTKRFEGGRWSGWSSLGASIVGEPSVVASGPGKLDLFARFSDDSLAHRALRDGRWSDWTPLGGALTSAPAASTPGGGRLVVFVRSTDNAIWEKTYDGSTWQPFTRVGGTSTANPAAASHADGSIDLYVRGSNGGLYHRTLVAGQYSPWAGLGGALTTGPAATSWAAGHRLVLALGTDGRVYQRSFSGGRWTAYTPAPIDGVTRSFEERLAPGVSFRSIVVPTGPLAIQVVTVDLAAPATFDTALGSPELAGLERTTSIAARLDALVAINGDFALSSGRPVHLFAEDGRLLQSEVAGHSFAVRQDEAAAYLEELRPELGVTRADGSRQRVAKVNAGGPGFDDVIEFTPEGGDLERPSGNGCSARLRSGSQPLLDGTGAVAQSHAVDLVQCDGQPLPPSAFRGDVLSAAIGGSKETYLRSLTPGESLTHRWSLAGAPGVLDAIGGSQMIVRGGAPVSGLDANTSFHGPNPRTAVATAAGKVFLVVVDGRAPGHSAGMTLRQLADFLVSLGATSGLNLDGGGSSTMVVNGAITNRPSDGNERGVANALVLLRGADPGEQGPSGQPVSRTAASADRTAYGDARFADPGSTGGYADALQRQGVPLSPGLRSAAERYRLAAG
ncbi:MAG TPA: phosphodiester glycosidase family protein [Mycobacteriales bacterium]|nr:phosphodiester glycosidase family protein [Mycobacteriales bacterium]